MGVFGWIASGILTDQAIKARAQYDDLVKQIEKDQAEQAVTVKLMECINTVLFQMKDLLPMMTKALAAMKELQGLFNSQHVSFDIILQDLGGIDKGVKASALKWRKAWIEERIDKAVAKYQEVCFHNYRRLLFDNTLMDPQIKETAEEFQRSAIAEAV